MTTRRYSTNVGSAIHARCSWTQPVPIVFRDVGPGIRRIGTRQSNEMQRRTMGVPAGKYHRRLGVPSVDDMGGTSKCCKVTVGILLRRYRREERLDELVVRSSSRFPYTDKGAFFLEQLCLLVGSCGSGRSSAGGPNGGNHGEGFKTRRNDTIRRVGQLCWFLNRSSESLVRFVDGRTRF